MDAGTPDDGDLRLLGRDFVGFRHALARQSEAWPGGRVHTEWADLDQLERALLGHGRARSGELDLVLVVSDWMPHLIATGDVVRLDEFLHDAPPDGWPQGWSPSMRSLTRGQDGGVYGLAYHDGPMMTLYRADLFDDRLEQEGFALRFGYALTPPQTWDQFVDQARWFTRPEERLWGTVMAGRPDGHNTVYDFLLQLWCRGGALSSGGEVAFDGLAGLAALRFLDILWNELEVIEPAARGFDSVASGQAFADGRSALMVNWCGFASLSALSGSPTAGKVRCAQVPSVDRQGSRPISMNVYWALAIASGSRHPDVAYDFMRHLASPDMDRITSEAGATGTRLSTWRDPVIRTLAPYYEVIEQVHRRVDSPPPLMSWPALCATLNTMVDDVTNRRVTPEDGVARAAAIVRRERWLAST